MSGLLENFTVQSWPIVLPGKCTVQRQIQNMTCFYWLQWSSTWNAWNGVGKPWAKMQDKHFSPKASTGCVADRRNSKESATCDNPFMSSIMSLMLKTNELETTKNDIECGTAVEVIKAILTKKNH